MEDILEQKWMSVPAPVRDALSHLFDRLIDGDAIFESIKFYQTKIEKLGWSFDYNEQGEIFNLRKL